MIDFDHSSTAEINAELTGCPGCCPETGCGFAEANLQARDSVLRKWGFRPYITTPAVPAHGDVPAVPAINPDAFDATTNGELIPVYRKVKFYYKHIVNSTQTNEAEYKGTGGAVTGNADVSYTRAINTETYREFICQQRRDAYDASNRPEGPCTPLLGIMPPTSAPGVSAAVGTLAGGIDPPLPEWHLVPVLISWTDNRPSTPEDLVETRGPKIGTFFVLVDGVPASGDPVPLDDGYDPTKLQIYLSESDHSCHEVCVVTTLENGGTGKWSAPVLFRNGGAGCCVANPDGNYILGLNLLGTSPDTAGDGGNWNTSNPTEAGFSGTFNYHKGDNTVASTVSNFACESFDPAPEDVVSNAFSVDAFLDLTPVDTVTKNEAKRVYKYTRRLDAADLTDVDAHDVKATGVTFDEDGNITGGTVTEGTLTGGNGSDGTTIGTGPFTGTLTGGTLTGGTIDGSGNLIGGTITGGKLSGGKVGGKITQPEADEDYRGWREVSSSFDGTAEFTESPGPYTEPATLLSDDINNGYDSVLPIFEDLKDKLDAMDAIYGWGMTIPDADWMMTTGTPAKMIHRVPPPTSHANVSAYWPVTNGLVLSTGIIDTKIELAVRIREARLSWTVPENHDANNYGVRWRIGFFSDKWLKWRGDRYAWCKALYDFFQAPEPGDPDYPVLSDFAGHAHPADDLAAAIDALQKDPRIFPPSGWTLSDGLYHKGDEELTEAALRDRYNLPEDPGTAPTAPVLVGDPFEWVWDSEQAAVDPETVDPCDPTFDARQPDPEPVRTDFPDTPEGLDSFNTAHDAWDAARDAAIERSKRTSPWYVITPPSLPSVPGSFYICDVRHICDMANPNGIIENYDHRFPTSELPALDPTEFDPSVYAAWF
jgi:hypothetical protein